MALSGGVLCTEQTGLDQVPPEAFQGLWVVSGVTWEARHAHEPSAGKIVPGKVYEGRKEEITFRRHSSGTLQQIWHGKDPGDVKSSKGITVMELTVKSLKYRWWSDHEDMYRHLTLNGDGTAVLKIFWPKEIETLALKEKTSRAAEGGEPAVKPADKDFAKPQPSAPIPRR